MPGSDHLRPGHFPPPFSAVAAMLLFAAATTMAAEPNAVRLAPGVDNVHLAHPVGEVELPHGPMAVAILDGTIAPPTPWQMQIYSTHDYDEVDFTRDPRLRNYAAWELKHRCGAVYIGDMWALTAAHCVLGVPGNLFTRRRVRGATLNLESGGTTFRIERAIVHAGYFGDLDDEDKRNDIALLKLEADGQTSASLAAQLVAIRVLDVGEGDGALHVPDTLIVTGWGVTSPHDPDEHVTGLNGALLHSSSRLKQAEMAFVTSQDCALVPEYHSTLGPQMICGDSSIGHGDTCDGDSGGPVVHKQAGDPLLAGLIVASVGCGIGKPTLFTYVPFFRDWIERAKDTEPGDFISLE
jgi:secreted trypsin-like serine protease